MKWKSFSIATHLSAPDTCTFTVQLDAVPFKTFKLLSLSEPCEVKVGLVKQDVIWQSDQFGSRSVLSSTKSQKRQPIGVQLKMLLLLESPTLEATHHASANDKVGTCVKCSVTQRLLLDRCPRSL